MGWIALLVLAAFHEAFGVIVLEQLFGPLFNQVNFASIDFI